MDTTKILAFRHPSQIMLLLESLIVNVARLPPDARKITDRSDLPSALQRIAIQAAKVKTEWAAWIQDGAIRFFTAEQSLEEARRLGHPVLMLCVYNQKGLLRDRSLWMYLRDGKWQRRTTITRPG